MPSRKYQQGYIFKFPRKNKKGNTILVMMKRTGFVDVTIGTTRFYYDEKEEYDSVEDIHMKDAFATDRRTTTKKGKIVVKKKSKN